MADVAPDGVTLTSGEFVRFQRKTDFVVCESCHTSYHVRDLLPSAGTDRPTTVSPAERVAGEEQQPGD